MSQAATKVHWWHLLIRRLSATRWGSRLIARRLQAWDRFVLRLTRGRTSATSAMTGLPVLLIRCVGAHSGLERVTPLLAIGDERRYLLIASNFGSPKHPAWYHNLKSNPQVEILRDSQPRAYIARELHGEPRDWAWETAVAHFAGYALYAQRAGGRRIPVLELTPAAPKTSD